MIRHLTLGFVLVALSACGNSSSTGQLPSPTSGTTKRVATSVNGVGLIVQYDPAASQPSTARVVYAEEVRISQLLSLEAEVRPAIERATACQVVAPKMDANRLMPEQGTTLIPVSC